MMAPSKVALVMHSWPSMRLRHVAFEGHLFLWKQTNRRKKGECHGVCCLPVAVLQFVAVGPLVPFFAVTEIVVHVTCGWGNYFNFMGA